MSITITGTAGCQFSITVTDTATNTGTAKILHQSETAIRSVTFTNASLVAALAGSVGTAGTTIDLFAIADANDGTYYMRLQHGNATIILGSLLTMVIHNKSANIITVAPGSSNSFLAASEQITIPAGGAIQLTFASGKTVSATVKNIKLTADSNDSACEIYILGNPV